VRGYTRTLDPLLLDAFVALLPPDETRVRGNLRKMAQPLRHFRRGATARQLGDLRRAKKRNCATLAETYRCAKPNDWRSRRAGRFGECVAVCKPCTTRCGTDACTLQSTRDLQSVQELQVLQALLQRRWHLLRVPLTPAQDSTSTQRVCACASPTHTAIACTHPLFAPLCGQLDRTGG